jgi:hypothetical protein
MNNNCSVHYTTTAPQLDAACCNLAHLCGSCPLSIIFQQAYSLNRGQDSSVGRATDSRLDGVGIESQYGQDFSHMSRLALGPTQPPVQWVPGLSQG